MFAFLADWLAVILFGAIASVSLWAVWPCAVAIGFAQHALGEIGHQSAHKQTGRFHRILMWLCFAPLAIDPAAYKRFHFAHHRHLGDKRLDPEVDVAFAFQYRWTEPYRRLDIALDLLGLHVDESLYVLRRMSSMRALLIYAVLMGMAFALLGPLVLIWPLASMTGMIAAHRLRARTEHQHFTEPGTTLPSVAPTWLTWAYLPHGVWMHKAHHEGRNDHA